MNIYIATGHLVADAELKQIPSGTTFMRFSIAINDYQGANKEPYTSFIDCIYWKPNAENLCQHLTKGKKIGICGKLRQNRWKTPENSNRSRVEIVVDNVEFLSKKTQNNYNLEEDLKSQGADVQYVSAEDLPF